jgi:hypothetical protein
MDVDLKERLPFCNSFAETPKNLGDSSPKNALSMRLIYFAAFFAALP